MSYYNLCGTIGSQHSNIPEQISSGSFNYLLNLGSLKEKSLLPLI